mgnify:CR=1 FL=1
MLEILAPRLFGNYYDAFLASLPWMSALNFGRDDEFLVEPLAPGEELELWAWYAAYDHVALAQIWGRMPDLPREIPRFTKDLRQRWDDLGRPALPEMAGRHDALV